MSLTRLALSHEHLRGVEIDEVSLFGDEDAFVGDVGGVNLADDLGGLPEAGNDDDVHGILGQPAVVTDDLAGAGKERAGSGGVGIHHDGEFAGIDAMGFKEVRGFAGASPEGDFQSGGAPGAKFGGHAFPEIPAPFHVDHLIDGKGVELEGDSNGVAR